jgi:stalled ribosome rescue protein Dom34
MTLVKKIGIWMDHSSAHLMEFSKEAIQTKIIHSKFTFEEKQESNNKGEHVMHNKEQREQHDYYKKLGEVIKNYNGVILFGPTSAKTELYNLLKEDHRFENIKIETQKTDNMTENQQHAFVRDYFSKQY